MQSDWEPAVRDQELLAGWFSPDEGLYVLHKCTVYLKSVPTLTPYGQSQHLCFLKKKDIILTEKGTTLRVTPQNQKKACSPLKATKPESWGLELLSGTLGGTLLARPFCPGSLFLPVVVTCSCLNLALLPDSSPLGIPASQVRAGWHYSQPTLLLHRSSVFKVPHQGIEGWVLKSGWRVSFEFLIVSPLASITDFDPTSGLLLCSLMAHSTPQGTATVTHYIFEL